MEEDASVSIASGEDSIETAAKKSASAKRRERKKKLIAGEKERAALGIPSTRTFGSSSKTSSAILTDDAQIQIPPQTPKAKQPVQPTLLNQTPIAITIAGPPTPRPSSSLHSSSALEDMKKAEERAGTEIDSVPELVRRKTRRGGKKARRRAENRGLALEASEVDDELFADNDTTSPTSSARTSRSGSLSGTKSDYSVDGASQLLDEDDEEERYQSSALESELGTPPNKKFTGSVMSAQDAASSIDR